MRKTALAFVFAFVAMFALAAMARPPIEQLVEGQQQCGNGTAVCLGDKKHTVRLQGPVSLETPGIPSPFINSSDGGGNYLVPSSSTLVSSTKVLINYDFPTATSGSAAAFTCLDSPGATIASCPLGSALLLGVDQALAAGGTGTLTPYLSAANTTFVRACVNASDAGVFNMPDASYIVRCIP